MSNAWVNKDSDLYYILRGYRDNYLIFQNQEATTVKLLESDVYYSMGYPLMQADNLFIVADQKISIIDMRDDMYKARKYEIEIDDFAGPRYNFKTVGSVVHCGTYSTKGYYFEARTDAWMETNFKIADDLTFGDFSVLNRDM